MPKTEEQLSKLKESRRREIAIAGLKVFCEKGYDSTTVDDIMKKAKCSHGLFYHYFKSKKEIFDEVMKIKNESRDSELKKKVESEPSARNKLKIIIQTMFSDMRNDENFQFHYFFFLSRCFSHKQKGEKLPEKKPDRKPFILVLEEIITEGQKNGEFSTEYSPREYSKLLVSIIQGATLGYVIAPKDIQSKIQPPKIDLILDVFNKENDHEK